MSTARTALPSSDHVVEAYSEATLPTLHGTFLVRVFREIERPGIEHLAIIAGDPSQSAGAEPLPVRVHSECWTGEVLGSRRCDCREQLDLALAHIAEKGRGVVVYLRQEGRGIGLGNKIAAYALQERGADTVDANRWLGFGDDLRTYEAAAAILTQLDAGPIELISNNPEKIAALVALGLNVVGRIPSLAEPHADNARYLETKRRRMGHLLAERSDSPRRSDR